MAFHPQPHGRPLVIQGNFQGGMPSFTAQAQPAFPQAAQRSAAPHEQAARPSRIGNAFRVPPTVNLAQPGQGRPLPDAVRQKMESFFNTDFSDVRVHVGAQAKSIGAVAFTMGSQIHFAPGNYNPDTSHGQRLLGHELMHVMQQRSGRVRNPFGNGVAVVQDPGMEAEADRMGIQAAAYRVPVQAKPVAQQQPAPGGSSQAPHVQAAVAQAKTAQPHDAFLQTGLPNAGVNQTVQQKRKRKGKGKFSTVAASPAANSVTNMFIQQHMGNRAAAQQMAQNRASSGISVSHTIDLTETARLLSEMQQRINAGYYIAANQVLSPHAGGMQYLTGNTYKIWETKIDNKGRVKKTKMITKRFYYDVLGIAGNALHHFDGPA